MDYKIFMMKTFYFTILLSIIFPINNSQLIDSIIINGNKRTKDYVIKREILHPIDAPLDSLILNDDINRLYNLGIFSKVDIYVEDKIYYVDLVESFSIVPIINASYDEVKDEFTYIAGVADVNFMGRKQSFFAGTTFGGEKIYFLGLENPWIFGDHISFRTELMNRSTRNIFYEFEFDEKINSIEMGFYRGLNNKFKFGLTYYQNTIDSMSISNEQYEFVLSKGLQHQYITSRFSYNHDTRDIYIDPTEGFLFQFQGSNYKGLDSTEDFQMMSIYFKQYFFIKNKILKNLVLSYKGYALFKSKHYNDLPIFAYEYLGGEDYTRGYSSIPNESPNKIRDLIENVNIIYTSIEIQNTILERKNYDRLEFGMDGFLFVDMGLGSKEYDKFNLDNSLIGYGFGVKFFITPVVFSVSLGFNPYGQSHLHLSSD